MKTLIDKLGSRKLAVTAIAGAGLAVAGPGRTGPVDVAGCCGGLLLSAGTGICGRESGRMSQNRAFSQIFSGMKKKLIKKNLL